MASRLTRLSALLLCMAVFPASRTRGEAVADFVITNGGILTVDDHFSRAEALAVRGEYIVAVGSNSAMAPFIGAGTRVIDARGKMVLPGLCDSHTHSYRASVSEFSGSHRQLDFARARLSDAIEGGPVANPGGAGCGGAG
jgi:predicted amidohydrolase YtcJ